jgi:hypothetical protein
MPETNSNVTQLQPGTRAYDLALNATNQPNAPTPRPQEDTTTAPDIGGAPASPAATVLAGNPQPPPPPTAQQAVEAHHSMLGRVAGALLGRQMDYQIDPQTGKTVAVPVQERPGDLFRHILAGALIGGAAAKGTNSVLAGFSRGGVAGIQANQQANDQRLQQAQQQFQNQQATDKVAQDKLQGTAQHEHWNKEELLHERDANLRDSEFLEKKNERAEQLQKWALEAGGMAAAIPGNGELRNGQAMMKLYTQDPNKFKAPSGYDRLITHDTDLSGLKHDPKGQGWIDGDGNPVNLEDRTTWRVSWVPQKPQPVDITGAKLNRLFPKTLGGLADPKQTYKMPWHQVVALGTNEHETARKEADEERKTEREQRLKETSARDQNRKDTDQTRKNKLADQKINKTKPVAIGSIGIVNGQRVMVTKIDANGNPTAGVPAP